MSVEALGWVLRHSPYEGAGLLVHIALADIANNTHDYEVWAKTSKIAETARVNPQTCRKVIRRMIDDGLLELVEDRSNIHRASRYRFVMPDDVGRATDATEPEDPVAPQTRPVAPHTRPVAPETRPGRATDATYIEREVEREENGNENVKSLVDAQALHDLAPEANRLAHLLAELIEANGSKPPTVTKTWVRDIQRMIVIDDRTPVQIERAIRWSQQDPFWRANILSPKKLREKYDQMRLQAQREVKRSTGLSAVEEYLADQRLTGGS